MILRSNTACPVWRRALKGRPATAAAGFLFVRNGFIRLTCAVYILSLVLGLASARKASASPTTAPTTQASGVPTTRNALAVPVDEQTFDASQYLLGDPGGGRKQLADHGITIEPLLIVDYSKNFMRGINTRSDNFWEEFDLPVEIDTEKLFGWQGGTFAAVYQLRHGQNPSRQLTGDAQTYSFETGGFIYIPPRNDDRAELGQLWYQQKFLNDLFRLRLGKIDGSTDFDALDNGQGFLNDAFRTGPTLGLMPEFPDTATGVQLFFEPQRGFYAGAAAFDGSGAIGIHTGEIGPRYFFRRAGDLFYVGEIGQRYDLATDGRRLPGRVAFGGWHDTNSFELVNGNGRVVGTSGTYALFDQLLWRPLGQGPVAAAPVGADRIVRGMESTYPGDIALSASLGWADPLVNRIDGNALAGVTWTGIDSARPIDELGFGTTYVHFSRDARELYDYELAIELFYRVRFTPFVSLQPDLQYIIHPSGSGTYLLNQFDRHNALAATLRLEMSF